MRLISVGGFAIVLAACASPEVYAQPAAPLTLPAAVAEALTNSPDLRPPADAVAVADIQRRLAQSAFGIKVSPRFGATSDPFVGTARTLGVALTKSLTVGTRTFVNVTSYDFGHGQSSRETAVTLGLSQPLLRGFGREARAGLTDAERARTGARRAWGSARAALVVRVTAQYAEVIKAERLLAAAEMAATRAATLSAASQARARIGLATELDVLRAQVLEAQLSASLGSARESVVAAKERLSLLIGRAGDAAMEVLPIDAARLSRLSLDDAPVEDLVREALAARPEVFEAHDRIGDAARRADIARLNLLPPVALDVSYTRRGIGWTPAAAASLNSVAGGWHVGLSTAYVLDRSAEQAAGANAALSLESAARAARDAEQRIAAEVRRLHRACTTAASTIAIQQRAVDLAARQLRLAEIRYERGIAGNFDVIDAQTSLLQARNALIAAELDRFVSVLDLRRSAGRLDPESFTKELQ